MDSQKTISLSCTSEPSKPAGQTADYIVTIKETGDTFTEKRVSAFPNKLDVLHQASSVFENIVGRVLKEPQWCGKASVDKVDVSLINNKDGTYTYTLTATVKPIIAGEKSYTNFTHRGAMSDNLTDAKTRRNTQDTGADGYNNGEANIKSKTADGIVKKIPTEAIDSNTTPTLYILEYFYLYNDKTYNCPALPPQPIPQDPNLNNAQYFRQVSEGNVAVEGRASNAVILDNTGNAFIVSGMNENEIKALQNQNYQGTVSINGNNSSYIAVKTKNDLTTQEQTVLGNTNYNSFNETLNQDKDPNQIITPQNTLPTASLTPTPLPVKETPVPTPSPTPVPVTGLEEGETVTEFLPEREDQEFTQVFDVAPIIGINEVSVSFNGIEIKNGKVYNTTLKSVKLSGNAKQKIKQFFDLFKDETLRSSNNTYVFPEVTMAQAIWESGYGKSVINTGNFFGITLGSWKGDYGLYVTEERGQNRKVRTNIGEEDLKTPGKKAGQWKYKRAFRHYKSVEEGFNDHNSILTKSYYKGYDEQGTPEKQMDIIGPTYATSTEYTTNVKGVIAELKPLFAGLYNVVQEGKKYKIIVNK